MEDRKKILKKLQTLNLLYIPFSKATKLPYVECDPETFDDQVFIYASEEAGKKKAEELNAEKLPVELVHVEKAAVGSFYVNLKLMGVNALLFGSGDQMTRFQLDDIVKLEEIKNESGKPPKINSELALSTVYFMQQLRRPDMDPKDQERAQILRELEEEMTVHLTESVFIMPLSITKAATETEEEETQLRLMTFGEGQEFQPVFSDMWECQRFLQMQKIEGQFKLVMLTYDQLPKALVERAKGYVLNSSSTCLILPRGSFKQNQ